MGVEQVRGAVQGDDRLARAGSTLHDQHSRLRRADDLVLLGLDRGDDVAERAGAAAFERGQESRVAAQRRPALLAVVLRHQAVVVADAQVAAAEELVLETEHRPTLDDEVAPPQKPHRLAPGRPVERLGDWRPPVDDDRLGPLVGDGQPADVERLGRGRALGVAVDTPEDESGVAEVEVGEPLDQRLVEGVALEPGLERAAEVRLVEVAQTPSGLPRPLEAFVGVIHVGLLGRQFGVLLRHSVCEQVAKRGSGNSIGLEVRPDSVLRAMSIEVSPPFLAAAKGLVGAHTPVWFMRQAGRSLPEYRAVRGDGSILDAIARPDLAAEITLQPVRRYGVDAAVLFSDIVVPAHAVGFGIDVAPGTGPVAAEPLRHRDDLRRLRPLQAEDVAARHRDGAHGRRRVGPGSSPYWRSPAPRSPWPAT